MYHTDIDEFVQSVYEIGNFKLVFCERMADLTASLFAKRCNRLTLIYFFEEHISLSGTPNYLSTSTPLTNFSP